ncbi:MAG: extracellular solute-binding protein [Spirochaetia bacterium]|nr:MAG: extracellular solute-binding protein [Spirochaetia bacterium]
MQLSRNQIIILGGIGLVILFFVLVFLGVIPGLKPSGSSGWSFGSGGGVDQTKLSFWGTAEADSSNSIQRAIEEYSKTNASAQINYRHFDNAEIYEKTLLNALATGQGPDIFMFRSGWLAKHYGKAAPAPEPLNLNYIQQAFPDVIRHDFSIENSVYALPLYIDTLALIYNKDIFNAKSIALVPKTWTEFESLTPQLRELNILNQITKPAAAIGGSGKSINTASDLLSLLMLQTGSQMVDSQGQVNFGQSGLSAFNFYIQFANPSSGYYTWNDNIGNSIDLFSQGDLAVIFNYQSSIVLIKEKNPYLNLGVGAMPQSNLDQPVNYSDYWGLAVSRQSKNQILAWNFVAAVTADPKISDIYLQTSGKPPALRSLIDKYKNDSNLGVFAKQALTAKSWSKPDSENVKQIFSNMIEYVLNGKLSSDRALEQAKNQVNAL